NSEIVVNGRWSTGQSLKDAGPNQWTYNSETHVYGLSKVYRADITPLVKAQGEGVYAISNLVKCREIEVNGASLLVFLDDGNANNNNNSDVALYEGNDSTDALKFFATDDIVKIELQGTKVFVGGNFPTQNAPGFNRIARL